MKRFLIQTFFGFMVISIMATGGTAYASGKKTLKMSSVWSTGIDLIEIDKNFVKLVNELGAGQLQIEFHPGGDIVPPFELFNAVSSGTLDLGGDWGGYWAGKDEAFNIIGSHPMGLTATDYMIWIYQAGGLEVINEVYGNYGLVVLPFGVHSSESGVRGHKAINSLADYRGLKTRMGGKIQGLVLKDMGGVQVMLAGSEVYQALQKNVIDAVEYNTPAVDYKLGLAEVTEYWATPAWHAPSAVFSVIINQKVWANMSELEKAILKTAAMANFTWSYSFFEYQNIAATKGFLDAGIKITRLSDADLNEIQKYVNKHTLESAQKNPLFAKVALSQAEYLRDISQWRDIAHPFGHGRNFETLSPEVLSEYIK